jgi:PhnB protein
MKISPYLNFPGSAAEALAMYEKVFGGKVLFSQTFGESPMKDMVPAEWHDKLMHATLQIGDQEIMASDAPPDRYNRPQGFYVSYATTDVAAAERIYAALIEGGQEHMALQQTFWAERFGMLADKFGIPWMINCEKPA